MERQNSLTARIRLTPAEQRKLRKISRDKDQPVSRLIADALRIVYLEAK